MRLGTQWPATTGSALTAALRVACVRSLSFDTCSCFYVTLLRLTVRLLSMSSWSHSGGAAADTRKAGAAACKQVAHALRLFGDVAVVAGPAAEGRLLDDDWYDGLTSSLNLWRATC